jgi:hypothetical protein
MVIETNHEKLNVYVASQTHHTYLYTWANIIVLLTVC